MGNDFSFLNEEQEPGTLPPAKGYVPEGWQKRQPGKDYWENDQTETSSGDELRPQDTIPVGQESNRVGEFQQKRAKAADFAKKQTLRGLDQLSAAHDDLARRSDVASEGLGAYPEFDYDGFKNKILASPPERYAGVLEQATKAHPFDQNTIDSVLRPSEDAVTAYKQLQMENAATGQRIQQQMAPADIQNARMQMASLDQTIEQTKQKMALSATSRQRDELKQNLDFFDSQKRVLQSKIPQQGEEQPSGEIIDQESTIDHMLTAAGHPRADAVQSLSEMRRMVQMAGISPLAAVSPLSFIPTFTNLVSHIFNPQVRDGILGEAGPPPPKDDGKPPQDEEAQKSTFGSDKLEQDPRFLHNQAMIDQKENRHQQIMQELANSGTFKNVADVLGFVLTSFLLGPKVSALFFSNMLKNGNLRSELDRLDHETTQLYHQQNSYIQLAQHARAEAAQEKRGNEQRRHNLMVEDYSKMKMGNKSAFTPEEKQTDVALQHSYRFQSGNLDAQQKKISSMEKVLDRGPIDPDFKAIKGVVSTERQKLIKMQQDFAQWKQKVRDWYVKHGAGDIEPGGTDITQMRE